MEFPIIIILTMFFIFLGSCITGLTGIGFALASVPFMTLFLPPSEVVPVVATCGFTATCLLVARVWKTVEFRRLWPLIVSGIAGLPLGILILKKVDANLLKLLIGIMVIAAALALMKGFKLNIKREKLAEIPVGLLSGLLHGSTSIGGPPIILFYTNQQFPKQIFRANVIAYFFCLQLVTLPAFFSTGFITRKVSILALCSILVLPLGLWIGKKLHNRVKESFFRILVLCIVIAGGLFAAVSAIFL